LFVRLKNAHQLDAELIVVQNDDDIQD
jgi:hypothetical protein